MAFKFLVLATLVTYVSTTGIASYLDRPIVTESDDPNPHYSNGYDVMVSSNAERRTQVESRSGDFLAGSFSLVSDGSRRDVDLTVEPGHDDEKLIRTDVAADSVLTAPAISRVAAPVLPGAAVAGAPMVRLAPVVAPQPSQDGITVITSPVTRLTPPRPFIHSMLVGAPPLPSPGMPEVPWAAFARTNV